MTSSLRHRGSKPGGSGKTPADSSVHVAQRESSAKWPLLLKALLFIGAGIGLWTLWMSMASAPTATLTVAHVNHMANDSIHARAYAAALKGSAEVLKHVLVTWRSVRPSVDLFSL